MSLGERQAAFLAETPVPFSYIVVLNKDTANETPNAKVAAGYANAIDATFPVLADPADALSTNTPWNGSTLPGKCAVAPDMTLLHCWTGHGEDTVGYDAIRAHAGL